MFKKQDKYILVITTAKDKFEAEKIANHLIEAKIAACVNIIDKALSLYIWEDKKCREEEAILLIKTKKSLYSNLEIEIKNIHSYKTPEIISFEIKNGSSDYLAWIKKQTT